MLAALTLSACTITIDGNHRPVGSVDGAIADAATIEAVHLHNRAGTIRIEACEAEAASVHAEVLLAERRPDTDFAAAFGQHVQLERQGAELTIRNAHDQEADAEDWQLRFVVKVPAGLSVSIRQTAGTVVVRLPKANDIGVFTTAGTTDLQFDELDGRVTADSEAGQFTLSIKDRGPAKGCSINCTAGTVTLKLPKDTAGRFDLRAATGNVSVDKRFGLKPERSAGSVTARGQVGQGGPMIQAHTVAGTVRVR